MKTPGIALVAMLAGIVLTAFTSRDNYISIEQALDEKKIQMEVLPYLQYEGDGIRLHIRNLAGSTLKLIIPKGTSFVPDADPEQTLIKSEDEIFVLYKNETKAIQFHGYCTELSDKSPDVGTAFRMEKTKNTKLLNLLNFMDSLQVRDENMIQHSIWCITDSSTVSHVGNEDEVKSKALRSYLCAVTGQKDRWYRTAATITETPGHDIVIAPKEVAGEITFQSTEVVHLYGVVKNSAGQIVNTSPRVITAPSGVEVTFEFALTIAGWEPGKYYVIYTNNGVEVINQEFEI